MKTKLAMGILLVVLLLALGWQRQQMGEAAIRAETATTAADSLRRRGDSLAAAYHTDTLTLTRWRTRWDSIVGPGRTDTLTVERVILVADSTVQACTAVVRTCEERVKTERERGDSLAVAAASWKRVARGKWISPSIEATLTPGLIPQAAGQIAVGRGKWRILARVEVGSAAVMRLGVVWSP
jgi:hypothetical protein